MRLTISIVILTLSCILASPVVRDDDDYEPNVENVYHLFTRSNPTVSQPLLMGNTGLLFGSNFNQYVRTVVLFHGRFSDPASIATPLVPAILAVADYNVIAVDWQRGANIEALDAAIAAGRASSNFINWLQDVTELLAEDFHVVGFSRGAHTAAVCARYVHGTVLYFTGLDPSPGWDDTGEAVNPNVASYTEIIWTDMNPNDPEEPPYGPYGHVDFYPNGGYAQPGCSTDLCSHTRSIELFAESLVSGGFTGTECATKEDALTGTCDLPGRLQMGGILPSIGARGLYYLKTNAASPFSIY